MPKRTDQSIRCSFCGKRENQATKLIAGPGVYICSDCVAACSQLLRDDGGAVAAEELQTPERLHVHHYQATCPVPSPCLRQT